MGLTTENRTKIFLDSLYAKFKELNVPRLELDCPECGHSLVIRANHDTQETFWGCSQYPECKHSGELIRGTRDLQDAYQLYIGKNAGNFRPIHSCLT